MNDSKREFEVSPIQYRSSFRTDPRYLKQLRPAHVQLDAHIHTLLPLGQVIKMAAKCRVLL
jgi:hypothetical protein